MKTGRGGREEEEQYKLVNAQDLASNQLAKELSLGKSKTREINLQFLKCWFKWLSITGKKNLADCGYEVSFICYF